MKLLKINKNLYFLSLLLGIPLIVVSLVCLIKPSFVQDSDSFFLDSLFQVRYFLFGQRSLSPYLVYVYDDDTQRSYNESKTDFVERISAVIPILHAWGVKSIALDFFLLDKDAFLRPLAKALSEHGPVVLPMFTLSNGISFRYPQWMFSPQIWEANIATAIKHADKLRRSAVVSLATQKPSMASVLISSAGNSVQTTKDILIDFPGPCSNMLNQYRLVDIVAWKDNPQAAPLHVRMEFQDTMVVIGDASSASKDFIASPFESMFPAGLTILLEADARMRNNPLMDADPIFQALVCFILALFCVGTYSLKLQKSFVIFIMIVLLYSAFVILSFCIFNIYFWGGISLMAMGLGFIPYVLIRYRYTVYEQRFLEARLSRVSNYMAHGRKASAVLHSVAGMASISKALAQQIDNNCTSIVEYAGYFERSFTSIEQEARTILSDLTTIHPEQMIDFELGDILNKMINQKIEQGVKVHWLLNIAEARMRIPAFGEDVVYAIDNVLSNALWAVKTKDNAQITIGLYVKHTKAYVHISDNGTGIGVCRFCLIHKCLTCIRMKPGYSSKPNGTGFGLSQVRDTLRSCHGGLHISSSKNGTKIILRLPLVLRNKHYD